MPRITLIVAVARNGVIGRDGGLPWHLPEDLCHFKRTTLGKPVIMGRRTHESVGRALPGRTNVVLSRKAGYVPADGCLLARTPHDALALVGDVDEVMVVGGAAVYESFLERADRVVLTEVDADVLGATRFPALDDDTWEVVSERTHPADDQHAYAMTFRVLERRSAP